MTRSTIITFSLMRRALRLWGNTPYARRWLAIVAQDARRPKPALLMHGARGKWGTTTQDAGMTHTSRHVEQKPQKRHVSAIAALSGD